MMMKEPLVETFEDRHEIQKALREDIECIKFTSSATCVVCYTYIFTFVLIGTIPKQRL